MRVRIQSRKDVVRVTVCIAVLCVLLCEAFLLGLYLVAGPDAFHMRNAVISGLFMPWLISVPITYYMTSLSLDLAQTQQELKRLADTDPLTGLPNRRSFFRSAAAALRKAQAAGKPCTLMVIDADYFKDLNDSFGHAVGDQALMVIAEMLLDKFRQADLLCRVGGEEFAVLLDDIDAAEAQPLAERVVEAVAASPVVDSDAIVEFSISCGLADTGASYELPLLFKAADDAMYQAKERGRNRVYCIESAA